MSRSLIRKELARMIGTIECLENNVFQMRSNQWMPESLPSCSIYIDSERAEFWTVSPRQYKRTMSVTVTCYLKEDEEIVEEMDDLALAIESVLMTDTTLDENCDDVIYTGSNFEISSDGETTFASLVLAFDIVYIQGEHAIDPKELPLIKKHKLLIKNGDDGLGLEMNLNEGIFPESDEADDE